MQYRFDQYILDTGTFSLSKGAEACHVEPQVIELLVFLIENRDKMVTKDEILQAIWPNRIVSESALSGRIKSARQAIGDDGVQQKFIRTIHKKGFRFVANVEFIPNVFKSKESIDSEHSLANVEEEGQIFKKPRILVLPLVNISNLAEQEYFVDGITTDIITYLSKHRWLEVIARNTSFGFKNRHVDISELAKSLQIEYVLEGVVQRAGESLRISVQLIDASNGIQKWSERYDRDITDIFMLQDEITECIVARLEPEIGLAEREKVAFSRPTNLHAWECYHLGLYQLYQFTSDSNVKAQSLLLKSQTLDPYFGEAHAWWAYATVLGMVYWYTEPSDYGLKKALEACDQAIKIDSKNATYYALRARVQLARLEYDSAIRENEKAIALNPTLAVAYCSLGDSLAYEGQYVESIEYFNKAITLSPNDPQMWAFLSYGAQAHLFNSEFQTALEWAEKAESIPHCQYWASAHKLVALYNLGKTEQLQSTIDKIQYMMPEFSCDFARKKLFYLKRQDQIDFYLNSLQKAGVPVSLS